MSKRESIDELLAARMEPLPGLPAVVLGELVALADEGCTPLVLFAGQPSGAAVRARTVVDLHGAHIGHQVTLVFEAGDPTRPIVTGVLREAQGWPLADLPGQVEVSQDGRRMVVGAREQLVMRCGKASITLTKAGKILIRGAYVASISSGVNRIKGGSVQLN
ncbi:hypothetical protein J2W28_006482 [Variovorax boronicumulans]|uniref:DUF6484 domain-containing protein n=1 Tax=Variovorax boronicumulans TaxID=436515 RepID=UPI00278291A8|nr:DUF6484 domain-containing protein [Variovorax boronicumulans]MDP9994092.1 hypothetical protein [Variovorax boronicumulans]MDQ0007306.1 hypothetical protein [Variovorax boronicumulans]